MQKRSAAGEINYSSQGPEYGEEEEYPDEHAHGAIEDEYGNWPNDFSYQGDVEDDDEYGDDQYDEEYGWLTDAVYMVSRQHTQFGDYEDKYAYFSERFGEWVFYDEWLDTFLGKDQCAKCSSNLVVKVETVTRL